MDFWKIYTMIKLAKKTQNTSRSFVASRQKNNNKNELFGKVFLVSLGSWCEKFWSEFSFSL
jgi:hypothetical protein